MKSAAGPSSGLPHYRLPRRVMFELGPDAFLGRRRSFSDDCAAVVRQMWPRPVVHDLACIPATGPFLLVANHFEGPGLWIGWTAALLTRAVARVRPGTTPVHWLVTAGMDRRRVDGIKRFAPLTSWFFGRIAGAWEMVALPRVDASPAARAAALRSLVRLATPPPAGLGHPAGLFPEGEGDGFAGLRPSRPGSGAFVALMARRGVPALPAAAWSQDGRLHVRFGPPWYVAGTDAEAGAAVMASIGALLPPDSACPPPPSGPVPTLPASSAFGAAVRSCRRSGRESEASGR